MLVYPVNAIIISISIPTCQRSSTVEQSLRKGEVGGSNPPVGS